MTLVKCLALRCTTAFYGRNASYPLDISSCYYAECYSVQRGSGYETGTPTQVGTVLFDWPAILRAMEPIVWTGIDGLGTADGAPSTDVFGRSFGTPPGIGIYEVLNDAGRWWRPQL